MAETVIVKSKVKEAVQDSNVGGDFVEALNETVLQLIAKAEERAKGNGRKTIQARDL